VINVSNYLNKDKSPPGEYMEARGYRRQAAPGLPGARGQIAFRGRRRSFRFGGVALAAGVALDWLAYFTRRWADRRFAICDTEAYWWCWQITKTLGGLGRRYRDLRFDTVAACARCAGAGARADAPCEPCEGTGRISLGAVS
jgi:hypothetical protein